MWLLITETIRFVIYCTVYKIKLTDPNKQEHHRKNMTANAFINFYPVSQA